MVCREAHYSEIYCVPGCINGYLCLQELKYTQQMTEEASKQLQSRLSNMQEEINAHSQANTMLKSELEAWLALLASQFNNEG